MKNVLMWLAFRPSSVSGALSATADRRSQENKKEERPRTGGELLVLRRAGTWRHLDLLDRRFRFCVVLGPCHPPVQFPWFCPVLRRAGTPGGQSSPGPGGRGFTSCWDFAPGQPLCFKRLSFAWCWDPQIAVAMVAATRAQPYGAGFNEQQIALPRAVTTQDYRDGLVRGQQQIALPGAVTRARHLLIATLRPSILSSPREIMEANAREGSAPSPCRAECIGG